MGKRWMWRAVVLAVGAAAVVLTAGAQAKKTNSNAFKPKSDREHLIGTWHLVAIDSPTPDGKPQPPLPIGLFIYTKEGFEAVQLMYPKSAESLNNEFVHDGYEASYGSFEIDETKKLLRHKVISANTRDTLVGTEELRKYEFPDSKHLVMRPADPNQHWSVTWEKY